MKFIRRQGDRDDVLFVRSRLLGRSACRARSDSHPSGQMQSPLGHWHFDEL